MTPGTARVELPLLAQRDASDLALFVAAAEGEADAVVSQDRDLLDLAESELPEGVEVLDPLGYLRKLRALRM